MRVANCVCSSTPTRHLRGQQFAEPFGDGLLRLADVLRSAIVELERALDVAAYGKRHDDGRLDIRRLAGEADIFGRE